MYKLVVSGFDGVLIDKEEAIGASTIMEIDRIRSQGKLFVVYTDRSYLDVLNYNKSFPFIDYIIGSNGAYLYDCVNDKVIYRKKISNVVLKKLLKTFDEFSIYGVTDDNRFLINDYNGEDIYQLEIECSNKKKLTILTDKLKKIDLNINFNIKKCGRSYFVQIIMNSVDKCYALNKICKIEKIKMEEVIGIGVDESDISMLSLVGVSVAVKNASSIVKKNVNITTSSNDDAGVKKTIKQLFK